MKVKFTLLAVCALFVCTTSVFAGSANDKEKPEFNRHWYMQVQAGASYTLGEGKFGKLVSPAAALNAGHQFSPVFGLRFGLSAWQSKGAWVVPATVYKYNYVQGNVDVTLDLANLFGRFNPRRTVNPFLFAGVGVNGAFNNDEANALVESGQNLQYIWKDSKVFVAGRLGAGVNFRLSDCVLLGLEVNANMLSDKYNSKKAGNLDWQFNALAGLTFRFGKNYKKSRAVAAVPAPAPAPVEEPAPAPVEEKPALQETPVQKVIVEKPAELRKDIFFKIGSSQIRTTEQDKVNSLIDYLKANPQTTVEVLGYADNKTGSHAINLKISKLRAESVAAALRKAGVAADRIRVDGKGDSVQPFSGVEQNRVSICIAK